MVDLLKGNNALPGDCGFVIDPGSVAFDIDGVVADTISLFIQIAETEFGISGIKYEEITDYSLEACVDIDEDVLIEIAQQLIDVSHKLPLRPVKDAPEVLARLGKYNNNNCPILFVTARPYAEPIVKWLKDLFPLESVNMEVIATGSFEAKTDVLLERKITSFVEDRLETCFLLEQAGIMPILFKQPWNRKNTDFREVESWQELACAMEI